MTNLTRYRSEAWHNSLTRRLLLIPLAVIVLSGAYLIARTVLFLSSDYLWHEKFVAALLLLAETFILIHGLGYFVEVMRVVARRKGYALIEPNPPPPAECPPVAVIVSAYKEPIHILEETLTSFYNLSYPNKQIYLLDDTRYDLPGADPTELARYRNDVDALCRRVKADIFRRRWHGAKAGMINDFLAFANGEMRDGFEIVRNGGSLRDEKPKYIVIFDADMNPFPPFVTKLVSLMETEPRMAFVQTPQYYTNFQTNRVAHAAGLQQAVFYEYICEGKSLQDAMFCCGTNVIFRREALLDVGGFDETSVTEDFATSLKFHLRGWHSAYFSHAGAFGLGPEDLGSYFKQQFRWALGTVGLFRDIFRLIIRNPRAMTLQRWWEYTLSGTYYFTGLVFFVLAICPPLYLFFGVPTFFARPELYATFFVPYFILTMAVYSLTLQSRHYRVRDILLGQLLIAVTFPVYIKAALSAVFGIRGKFVVTSKGGSTLLPLRFLWPQLGLAATCFAAFVWGANRIFYEPHDTNWAISANMAWSLYHTAVLLSTLYFRNPEPSTSASNTRSSASR